MKIESIRGIGRACAQNKTVANSRISVSACACLLLGVVMGGCKQSEPEYVDFSKYADEANCFVPMREQTSDVRDEAPWEQAVAEIEEAEQYANESAQGVEQNRNESARGTEQNGNESAQGTGVRRTSPLTVTDVARGFVEHFYAYKVHQVAGTYRSIDVHGDSLTVSGKFFYPENGVIKNLIIVSHYTIGANKEAPSETFSFEGMYAAMGYGVVIADYIGYGVTVDSIHPYLQAETTAHNVIDMALAVRPFIAKRGLKVQSEDVILFGYSQGGAATLHVQRVMENNPTYQNKFTIKKVYAGAGPYDIASTYDYEVKVDVTGIPCAVPLIIQGMSVGMDKPLEMSFFFKEPLLSNYNEWINSKKYTVNQMSTLIGAKRLSEILTENGTDRSNRETARFYVELQNNSIPASFIPKAPLYLFHSEDDETVPFINSQLMQRQFRDKAPTVTYNFGHYGTHMRGCLAFMKAVQKDLKKNE